MANNPTGKGGFKKGQVANPTGRVKGDGKGWQKPSDRMLWWLAKGIGELKAMAKDGRLDQQSSLDAMCIARILYAATSKENGADVDRVLDRAYGKLEEKLVLAGGLANTLTVTERKQEAQDEAAQMLATLSTRTEKDDKVIH